MKKLLSIFVTMCLVLSVFVGIIMCTARPNVSVWDGTHTTWTNGTGTEKDPYLIENAQQLAYLAYYVNEGNTSTDKYWKQTINIDLNGLQWTPIGYFHNNAHKCYFNGHFNGNEKTIANLCINNNVQPNRAGLFSIMDGGSIKNIGIVGNSLITGESIAGGIVGSCTGSVTIERCYYTGSISISHSLNSRVGGIVGFIHGRGNVTIIECYNTGSISSTCEQNSPAAGGIAGYINGSGNVTIIDCYNTGSISSSCELNSPFAGGIVGQTVNINSIVINNCYHTGTVSSSSNSAFGIAESNSFASINNSYYLENSAPCGGEAIAKSAAEMKTQEFVALLNNGPIPNAAYKLDNLLINSGFPIFLWQKHTDLVQN